MTPRRGRLVVAGRAGAGGRDRLRLSPRRLRAGAARPEVASPAARRARASRTFDPTAFEWTDQHWTGRQLPGRCSTSCTSAPSPPRARSTPPSSKLDHLVALGVDLVELLPVNAFNGTHNWGYDGVLWSAVHEEYGGPAAYQRFVDAAHAAGLGVVQDVVYNHLGPSGNYLPLFGPYLKTEGANTWGSLVNLDGEGSAEVRRFILDSALMWLRDFHVDGLRLDAVHALTDESDIHMLEELAVEVGALSAHLRRPLTLIAETDLNDTADGAAARGRRARARRPVERRLPPRPARRADRRDQRLLRRLRAAVRAGEGSSAASSTTAPTPPSAGASTVARVDTATMPTWRLVVCNQNHDQVGNRAAGDRLTERLDEDQLALCRAAHPRRAVHADALPGRGVGRDGAVPVLHLPPRARARHGHGGGTVARVRADGLGPRAGARPAGRGDLPPVEARLVGAAETDSHARVLAAYQRLAELRRSLPQLTDPSFASTSCTADEGRRVFTMRRGDLLVAVNFGDDAAELLVEGDLDVLFRTPGRPTSQTDASNCPDMPGFCWVPRDHRGVTLSPGRRRRAAAGTVVACLLLSACGANADGCSGAGTCVDAHPLDDPFSDGDAHPHAAEPAPHRPARHRRHSPELARQAGAAAHGRRLRQDRADPARAGEAAVHAARHPASAAGHRLRLTSHDSSPADVVARSTWKQGARWRPPTCPGCG